MTAQETEKTLKDNASGKSRISKQDPEKEMPTLIEWHRSRVLSIINDLVEGVAAVDGEDKFILLNRAAEKILAIDEKASIGKPVREILPDPTIKSVVSEAIQKSRERGHYLREFQSDSCFYEIRAVSFTSESKTSLPVVIVLSNVSGKIELDKKKDEFIALISHELRTPLTIIKGYLDITFQGAFGPLSPELQSSVQIMQEQCHSFDVILTDLIRFGMLSKGQPLATPEAITIFPFLKKYTKLFQSKLKSSRVTLSLVVPDPHITCFCDLEHFKDLIRHLLDNAIKFAGEGAEVQIRANKFDLKNLPAEEHRITMDPPSSPKRWVKVEVSDNGPGIPSSKISEIFNSFSQGEEYMTRKATGLGLGLALVKKIVEIYRGSLWINSGEGRGMTVAFLLPLIDRMTVE